jgi:hypothetical protein
VAVVTLFLLILAIKICYVRALSINSDEPQHLHVAWGWTQGMVQYRDFFDNHTPLFHLAMAPLVAWIGEQADILFKMRIAMMPLVATSLGCSYWLGARLYSKHAGIWAALLTGTCPFFLLKSSEFRADVLWMAVWLATLTFGLTGRFTHRRAFATGLLLGITFGVSMKTSLLLVSLLASLGLVLWLSPKPERKALLTNGFSNALLALAGLCVVPLAIAAFFAAKDALPNLIYCVFEHNTLPGIGIRHQSPFHIAVIVFLLPLAAIVGRAILLADAAHPLVAQRALVFLTGAIFLLLLFCFWPHVTSQDYLPVVPLFAISVVPPLLRIKKTGAILLLLIASVQIIVAVKERSPFSKKACQSESLVADVLQLTKPSDFVMDSKGETIFRRRPFYYVLETLTQRRMGRGLIPDTITEEMVKTRTCVSLLKRLPEKSMQWVEQYYVPVTEQILVAGCFLPPSQKESGSRRFDVGIAANYVVTSADGPVKGTMDSVSCEGPVFLNPGPHTFSCADPRTLVVFWAQAAQRGFTPFHSTQNPEQHP